MYVVPGGSLLSGFLPFQNDVRKSRGGSRHGWEGRAEAPAEKQVSWGKAIWTRRVAPGKQVRVKVTHICVKLLHKTFSHFYTGFSVPIRLRMVGAAKLMDDSVLFTPVGVCSSKRWTPPTDWSPSTLLFTPTCVLRAQHKLAQSRKTTVNLNIFTLLIVW